MFVDGEGQSEGAVDDGGPSREFLRLLVAALRDSRYFEGPEGSKNLSLVHRGVEFGDYKIIGQMLSLALLQGGVRPSFLSQRLYTQLCRQQTGPVSLEEVGDWELRQHLDKIKAAETFDEAQRAVGEAWPALCTLGCAMSLLNMESRQALIEEAARAHVEGRVKPALDQLIEGLDCLKVAEAMRAHPDILRPIFVSGHAQLTVQSMMTLFETVFSPPGSNARRRENLTLTFWRDWLIEVGDGSRAVTLQKILIFVSGVEQIPPLGFPHKPQIEFLHTPLEDGSRRRYPEANTCSVILRLPIHETFDDFVDYMESSILQSPTFDFV
ncbi:G2/M phase-specific E3 ubiquitin-protein ligase-like [Fundulus heteroclitus]|uniref:G2/M phase-specific E3 ubiquitin-protein ligase-like n=1 Tax=Fundulus heteroclitus TaxID=8078 RepID=UPI00165C962F|nr:G2/M phase-specific E3 ubiquitin-protein ligase-like [Fundulus heteroclitus]